jgi:hypothetical protein
MLTKSSCQLNMSHCRSLYVQDELILFGWPKDTYTGGISQKHMKSLLGESVFLGSMAIVLYSVYCIESAPWWPGGVTPPNTDGPEPRPKRRRTGK